MIKSQYISLRIILLFTVAILSTFLGELLSGFLGDWECDITGMCHYGYGKEYYSHVHWGYRHWLYFVMCVMLFIIQANDVIQLVKKQSKPK